MFSEAHLPKDHRSMGLVHYLPRPKKTFWGWTLFISFLALNEVRGIFVAHYILGACSVDLQTFCGLIHR